MSTVSTTIKLDSDLKREAQAFFDKYGLSLNAAVTMFLRQTVLEQAIPFQIGAARKPLGREEVLAALEAASSEARQPGYQERLISHDSFLKEMRGASGGP